MSTARLCVVFVCVCPHVCLRVRLFVWLSTRFALLCYAMSLFVFCLVCCIVLYAHNLQPSPPLPCHLLAAVLESKGRCNSNGNSRGNVGRPYTFWPSLQTHISRSVNAAPRPLGVKTTEVSHWKSWSFPGACLTLKASHGRYEAKPHNKA